MMPKIMVLIADFLNITLFQNSWIFFNLWSIIHIIAGFLIMKYLIKIKYKNKFVLLGGLLIAYELFEYLTIARGSQLFRPELQIDYIYDVLYGLLGGYLYKNNKLRNMLE